jgi:hypothetical protein
MQARVSSGLLAWDDGGICEFSDIGSGEEDGVDNTD